MATKILTAGIQKADGSEGIGLTVTFDIYDTQNASWVVEDGAATDVGKGGYKYEFSSWDPGHDYLLRTKVADLSGWAKYAWGKLESMLNPVVEVDADASDITIREVLADLLAYVRNKRSGGGTFTLNYRNAADSLNRFTQTVNETGEVSAVAKNVSDL